MSERKREELAWCAGFFDGEGNVCVSKDWIRSQTAQIDRLVLDRLIAATGIGRINGPYVMRRKDHYKNKPQYFFSLNGFEEVQAFIAMIWPWLGQIKRSQARKALLYSRTGSRETLRNNSAACQAVFTQAALSLPEHEPTSPQMELEFVNG